MGRKRRAELDVTLERQIATLLGYEHVVLFGRARSALVAIMEEIVAAGAPVIIPSNACSALLAAIVAAECTPLVASVSARTGLVADAELAAIIEGATGEPGLVVLTHLYGMVADYPASVAAARRRGWQLVENDSLASTAFLPARPRHGCGLLVSFGHGKSLDGGGGGAFLTDDGALAAALSRRAARWPVYDQAADTIEDHAVLARRHLAALGVPEGGEALLPVEAAQCRHAFDAAWRDRLQAAIAAFPAANDRRLARLAAWRSALESLGDALSMPALPVGAAWRGVFRVRDGAARDAVVAALRGAGFDAGTNYPPLWDGAPKLLGDQRADGGDAWGATVLTLWLTEAYDNARISAGADLVARTLERRAS